jgi:hypothetical protein
MEKDKSIPIVLAASFYLLCYILLLSSDATVHIAVLMFSLSPLVIVWMVISVLKQENKNKKTFDNFFYEDVDERRTM